MPLPILSEGAPAPPPSRSHQDGAGVFARRLYVETYGCQMNSHDSERLIGLMAQEGYAPTDDPGEADVIVINSCSVRDKAEHKLLSAAGKMKREKRARPDVVVALAGCVAQQEGKKLLERAPHVDLVFGPDHIPRFPEMVRRVRESRGRFHETEFLGRSDYAFPELPRAAEVKVSAYLSVMKGCDKFCTFCVVPMTRGREVSRPAVDILAEARALVERGAREIVLLGQTVNSYGRRGERARVQRGQPEPASDGSVPFHELLHRLAEIAGLERIRFTSPHPADFTDEQIAAFRELPKLCPHMHLPVQSGSTRVLAAMRRGYSREEYLELVERFRAAAPDAALTTDVIVGFPGETEEDFEATLELFRRVRFASAFMFAYSERTNTAALAIEPSVPPEERLRRLHRLHEVQDPITRAHLEENVGRRFRVLVEGPSKSDPLRSSGRTGTNRWVHVDGVYAPGALLDVIVEQAFAHSSLGRVVEVAS